MVYDLQYVVNHYKSVVDRPLSGPGVLNYKVKDSEGYQSREDPGLYLVEMSKLNILSAKLNFNIDVYL